MPRIYWRAKQICVTFKNYLGITVALQPKFTHTFPKKQIENVKRIFDDL